MHAIILLMLELKRVCGRQVNASQSSGEYFTAFFCFHLRDGIASSVHLCGNESDFVFRTKRFLLAHFLPNDNRGYEALSGGMLSTVCLERTLCPVSQ